MNKSKILDLLNHSSNGVIQKVLNDLPEAYIYTYTYIYIYTYIYMLSCLMVISLFNSISVILFLIN